MCETKPIWRSLKWQVGSDKCQANGTRRSSQVQWYKQTQFRRVCLGLGGQICETKPILRLRIGDCGFRTDLWRDAPCGPPGHGPVVQTNPISESWTRPGADCAKQTQFAPERYEGQVLYGKRVTMHWVRQRPQKNKANWAKRLSRQTKPIGRHGAAGRDSPPCRSRADYAKRSQKAVGGS